MVVNDKIRNSQYTIEQVRAYLGAHRIPPKMVRAIQETLTNDAMEHNDALTTARFFTACALVLHDDYGWGVEKRIPDFLHKVDKKIGLVADHEITWSEMMEELKQKTGLVINTDPKWSETEIEEGAKEV